MSARSGVKGRYDPRAVLYDAWLTKGGVERQVALEHDSQLAEGDAFTYENEVYSVTRVDPGHHDFVAVIAADWKGDGRGGRLDDSA